MEKLQSKTNFWKVATIILFIIVIILSWYVLNSFLYLPDGKVVSKKYIEDLNESYNGTPFVACFFNTETCYPFNDGG